VVGSSPGSGQTSAVAAAAAAARVPLTHSLPRTGANLEGSLTIFRSVYRAGGGRTGSQPLSRRRLVSLSLTPPQDGGESGPGGGRFSLFVRGASPPAVDSREPRRGPRVHEAAPALPAHVVVLHHAPRSADAGQGRPAVTPHAERACTMNGH